MKQIFETDGIPPKVYQEVLTRKFGKDWLTWLPETLYTEIENEWGLRPSPEVSDKINALKVFLTTDLFYHDAAVFEHIVLAVNDVQPDVEVLNLASPDEVAYTLYVLGPFDTKMFEREILAYIRACCDSVGLLVYPEAMSWAQPAYGDQLKYYISQIKPELRPIDSKEIADVQSNKLYSINQAVVDRIAKFDPAVLN